MPRFYFHLSNETGFTEDEEGRELPDAEAARKVALKGARSIMADELMSGEIDLGSFIEVEDEAHNWLFTVTFEEAVSVKPRQ